MLGGLGRGCQISHRSFWVSCALLFTSCPSCCVRPPGRDAMVLGGQLGGMLQGGRGDSSGMGAGVRNGLGEQPHCAHSAGSLLFSSP